MENYIINNNTIAVLKSNKKTIIFDVDNIRVINKSIKKVLEDNCLINGSTTMGRKQATKNIISDHYKIPIFLNNNIILIQLNSLRDDKCLFIVLNKMINYKYIKEKLYIKSVNNYIFINKISKNSFERLLINGIKLNNYLKYKKLINKNENFV